MLKVLKVLVLFVLLLILSGILYIVYVVAMGLKSGDLSGYVKEKAVEAVIDTTKLSPNQQELLELGDVDGLVQDLSENMTPEQIDCAVAAVGETRAKELLETKNPTPAELVSLSKCL